MRKDQLCAVAEHGGRRRSYVSAFVDAATLVRSLVGPQAVVNLGVALRRHNRYSAWQKCRRPGRVLLMEGLAGAEEAGATRARERVTYAGWKSNPALLLHPKRAPRRVGLGGPATRPGCFH